MNWAVNSFKIIVKLAFLSGLDITPASEEFWLRKADIVANLTSLSSRDINAMHNADQLKILISTSSNFNVKLSDAHQILKLLHLQSSRTCQYKFWGIQAAQQLAFILLDSFQVIITIFRSARGHLFGMWRVLNMLLASDSPSFVHFVLFSKRYCVFLTLTGKYPSSSLGVNSSMKTRLPLVISNFVLLKFFNHF